MASISAPFPKYSAIVPRGSRSRNLKQQSLSLSSSSPSFLAGSVRVTRLQGPKQVQFPILRAQVREAFTVGSSSASPSSSAKLETPSSDGKDPKVEEGATHLSALSESTISAFMTEVSDLVKLVDSRDIMELKLKHMDCELIIRIIRKKGAFVQSAAATPVVMVQHPHQPMLPPYPLMSQPAPAAPPPSASAPTPPSPIKGSKSTLSPLKCPMAGTFYRSSAPGEPPFVKADQSGTVVEILAGDGKPISVDTPLLVIQP